MTKSELHDALACLRPRKFSEVPVNELKPFLSEIFSKAELIVNSVPPPPNGSPFESSNRSRPDSIPATSATDLTISKVRRPLATGQQLKLQESWGKPLKMSNKDAVTGISVFKTAGHDRHGAWFARSSVHEGLGFEKWKKAMQTEFPESLAVQGGPGEGNVRGIGGDKRLESVEVEGMGKMEVYQLSAQFPGPTSPREFITLLLTSDHCLSAGSQINDRTPRHYMVVSIPVDHPEAPPRDGLIRGTYESVEMIREIPLPPEAKSENNDGKEQADDSETNPVEWIMITRSDPGGGIPRFMVERNTPSSIVQDAVKFLNWACAKDDVEEEIPVTNEQESPEKTPKAARPSMEHKRSFPMSQANGYLAGVGTSIADNPRPVSYRHPSTDRHPTLLQSLADDVAPYVPNFISDQIGLHRTDTSSSSESDTSTDSFASAEQFTVAPEAKMPAGNPLEPTPSSMSEKSIPISTSESLSETTQHNHSTSRELHKIEQKIELKTKEFKDKLSSSVHAPDGATDSSATAAENKEAASKAARELERTTEKHNRERQKQQEKFDKEIRKLEAKREKETRKLLARQQKEEQKNQQLRLQKEREEWKNRAEGAEREVVDLKVQIGELQRENTALVAKVAKMEGGLDVLREVRDEMMGNKSRGRASSVRSSASGRSGMRKSDDVRV
ncbi:hypothetical protein GQ43DRAFT_432847 [Delitschia confertaspora ATCC 74209]|uniref:DUF3074 domain-containing protein n=1 Tax=Delitschia confertaspora ATCC 74209 TaxID=1513339 RepID=A0A9P4JIK7_9PLEO|nr:hypothetical protein GQ43DRAFT_432847 [Delitschia confertaspora ATCC 74209]